MAISPIDTYAFGYKFRSRLEARWACFFDQLGIDFEYEKEGYRLDSGLYLPDFWLPKSNCYWAEVKAEEPTPEEDRLMQELCYETGAYCIRLIGLPEDKQYTVWDFRDGAPLEETEFWLNNICFTRRAGAGYFYHVFCPPEQDPYGCRFPDVAAAAEYARCARFEHGEKHEKRRR